ncbi:MAG: hypothetical protein K1X29_11125 [Bdellovibrionales bacterium]|nr:hypothetical protein [Bdellovibrionales bacterium]
MKKILSLFLVLISYHEMVSALYCEGKNNNKKIELKLNDNSLESKRVCRSRDSSITGKIIPYDNPTISIISIKNTFTFSFINVCYYKGPDGSDIYEEVRNLSGANRNVYSRLFLKRTNSESSNDEEFPAELSYFYSMNGKLIDEISVKVNCTNDAS